jgi:hypothetical protein
MYEIIKLNTQTILKDKGLYKIVLIEWIFQTLIIIIGFISLILLVSTMWVLADSSFFNLLIIDYPIFKPELIITICIISFIILISSLYFSQYLVFKYDIYAMYYYYNILNNKNIEFSRITHKKFWSFLKLKIWTGIEGLRLSFRQIAESKDFKNNSELKFYDGTLVTPLVFFENMSKEEALKVSTDVLAKDRYVYIRNGYKREIPFMGYQLGYGVILLFTCAAFYFLFRSVLSPFLLYSILFILFCVIQLFAMLKIRFYHNASVVSLYSYIRGNK